jgi:parallel beta-helix repeat protein
LTASPAFATTYYVSTGGSDAATGLSTGTPWRTLHYSFGQLAANDSLIVMPGTYDLTHETTDTVLNLAVNNVTIEGQTAGTAILDGIGALTWVDGIRVSASDCVIKNLDIMRFQSSGVYLNSAIGAMVHNNTIYNNGTSGTPGKGVVLSSTSTSEVHSNTIYWSGDTNYRQNYGVYAITGTGNTNKVYSNTIYGHSDSSYTGVALAAACSPEVKSNTIHDNDRGISLDTSDANISLNHLYDNKTGVYCASLSSSNAMIWNNLITGGVGTLDYGVVVEMVSAGTMTPQVYHNTIDGGAFAGVRVVSSGANPYVYYNMITNFSAGAGISNVGGSPTMRYNNINGCGATHSGVSAGTGDNTLAPGYLGGGNYHLANTSAVIDMIPTGEADPVNLDLDSIPRPSGSGFDPGCYEYYTAPTGTSVSVSFPPGTTAGEYISKAVPVSLNDPTPAGAFGPQIGFYDITLMRIGGWDPNLQGYVEYPGNGTLLEPGMALWFLFRYGQTITFSGTATPTQADPKDSQQACRIPLKVGWNQVGNPFPHPVSIANMVVSNADGSPSPENLTDGTLSQGIFWVYSSGVYYAAAKLPAAEGGWVKKTGEDGYLWVKDITVAYPDLGPNADPEARGLSTAPDTYDRPPSPPGGGSGSGWSSSGGGGGGGGGGCFVQTLDEPESMNGGWTVLGLTAGLGLALLCRKKT